MLSCAPRLSTIASPEDDPKDQWSRGVYLYTSNCASCHGENGEGNEENDRPAIAGEDALQRFDTAASLFAYVKESMPPLDTGCLSDDQLYAVTNYVLKQANVPIPEEVTPRNAGSIKLR